MASILCELPQPVGRADHDSLVFLMDDMRHIFSCAAVLALTLASCVETIDLDPHDDGSLVVNCVLTEDDTQTLELYYTSGLSGDEPEPVKDAEVRLMDSDGVAAEFKRGEDGLWRAVYHPVYDMQYCLEVEAEGQSLRAFTRFPTDIHVDTYGRRRWSDNSRRRISYLMYSYELRLYDEEFPKPPYVGRPCRLPSHLWIFPKDKGWGEDYQEYIATSHFLADAFNLTTLTVRDLTCFSADSVKVMETWLKEQLAWYPDKLGGLRLHKGFVRIDIPKNYSSGMTHEELTNTPVYSDVSIALARAFPTEWKYVPGMEGPYRESVYDFYILSDEADRYFRDVYRKHLNKDNFLFEYDTENVYSNVQGGLGVFGAMIVRGERPGVRGYLDDFASPIDFD